MIFLVLGLLLFLSTHSIRIFAEDWRSRQLARLGEGRWKGLYSLVSLAGFVLLVWGYGMTRTAQDVWTPPYWTRYLALLLMAVSFVLIAGANVKGTHIKAAVGHPMVLGVKVWALAHLLANGRPGDILLFGSLLVWATLNYRAARRRDRLAGVTYPPGPPTRDAIAIMGGLIGWVVFVMFLHQLLIGVSPLG
jgi:uncharacterized membrane protein